MHVREVIPRGMGFSPTRRAFLKRGCRHGSESTSAHHRLDSALAFVITFSVHDLKFSALFPISLTALSKHKYRFAECRRVAKAYRENTQLMYTIPMVPGYAFMNGEDWALSIMNAMRDLGINDPTDSNVHARASKIWDEHDMEGFTPARINQFNEATETSVRMASLQGRSKSHGALHDLLKAMVLQAWTAFEVLAHDLWAQVVTLRPELRSQISNNEWKKAGHRSLSKIGNLYSFTFRNDNLHILSIFDDQALKGLALTRNLIVHTGGRIDEQFKDQRKGLRSLYLIKQRKINASIKLNGENVRAVVYPVTALGYSLVIAVDKWLHSHP